LVRWLDRRAVLLLHDESIAMFGGASGLRDAGLLDSALGRAPNRLAYKPTATLPELAAAYAHGLAQNHPFVDGNKRSAFMALGLFLHVNGYELTASQVDAIYVMLALAAGDIDEAELAQWIHLHCRPRGNEP
jgi:death-on-curing protein